MELTVKQQQDIGLPFVLDRLLPLSPLGRERKRALRPYARRERAALLTELDNLGKAVALGDHPALARFRQGLMQLRDIRATVNMLGERPLDQVELFELKRYLLLLQTLAADFDALQESAHWEGLDLRDIPEALSILDPEGDGNPAFSLRSQWSVALAAVRAEKAEIEKRIAQATGEAREALLTERTGIVAREAAAEQVLCTTLSQKLLPCKKDLADSLDALGRLDLLFAKAALVRELGGVEPTLTETELSFTNMVHPAIDQRLKDQGAAFTPLTISLAPGAAVLTGANMGGKSVCLKTLALNVYLTHCGLFPFAQAAQVPFFDDLCLVRGEGEDGREGLSSFGGELMAADAAARAVGQGFCLVLFDEFARGTNPAEAVKLQQGALSYFGASGSVCLFVTHYDAVAARSSRRFLTRGIRDLDVMEGRRQIAGGADKLAVLRRFMDYGIEEVTAADVPQKALAVAELLGVEEGLLKAIRKEYIYPETIDKATTVLI